MKKIPISVLVIIYTKNKDILLLKKNNDKDMWQSVTGSLNENEKPIDAAKREVFEETGLTSDKIVDCNKQYIFEIYEMWRHKYEDGVTHNTEHVFLLELEEKIDIVIDKSEHLQYEWLSRVKAAEKVFSHTNRQAIFDLI
ncbi:MAG: dihydroneopterin triphosphate diphosphatase [Gammaproteobacteria bacterium]|tara:strand:+ start:245 stop:664 length:420 start_codon:yes stop_codon:yes gene_type:complete